MKKLVILLCMTLSITFSQQVNAQTQKAKDLSKLNITALLLKNEVAALLKNHNYDSYSIDAKGVLKPAKGYSILYLKKYNKLFITKNKGTVDNITMDGSVDIGHGITFRCFSDDDNCTKCMPNYNKGTYYCNPNGCNSCLGEILMPPGNISEFITQTGNYTY